MADRTDESGVVDVSLSHLDIRNEISIVKVKRRLFISQFKACQNSSIAQYRDLFN